VAFQDIIARYISPAGPWSPSLFNIDQIVLNKNYNLTAYNILAYRPHFSFEALILYSMILLRKLRWISSQIINLILRYYIKFRGMLRNSSTGFRSPHKNCANRESKLEGSCFDSKS
jgi:hypothetical protein